MPTSFNEQPEHNLAMDLVRVTETAAMASARWLGRGDKHNGDKAAVDAMRLSFNSLDICGTIIIGEGEKDNAPMLYNGEKIGTGRGIEVDIAVDPVEGTNLLATGRPNAISVIGVTPKGKMYNPGPSFYMQKLVLPFEIPNISLDEPIKSILEKLAKASNKKIQDLTVFVLEKSRHSSLVFDIRKAGARIQLHTDGDVAGALMAVDNSSEVDMMIGTGGTPEGVLAACAIRSIGGYMIARLDPQSEAEKKSIIDYGLDLNQTLTTNDLCKSEDVFFAATGISGGTFLGGISYTNNTATTHSLILRGKTGTIRKITSTHRLDKLMKFSAIEY